MRIKERLERIKNLMSNIRSFQENAMNISIVEAVQDMNRMKMEDKLLEWHPVPDKCFVNTFIFHRIMNNGGRREI